MARRRSTPSSSINEISERKATILDAVVNEHIATASPVGSQAVVENAGLNVSSATVRSEMSALERSGFLTQPHTSSGRVPTEKGYRYFVDHLKPGLGTPNTKDLASFVAGVQGNLRAVYEQIAARLSEATKYPSFIMSPTHGNAVIRDVHLVQFNERRVLVVATLSDFDVEKRVIDLTEDVSANEVADAGRQLTALLVGSSLNQRVEVPSLPTITAHIVRQAVSALLSATPESVGEQLVISGQAKVADNFDSMETARVVLDVLEQELVVVSLFKDLLQQGLSVAIGSEHGYTPLASCAVVVAPLTVDGVNAGAVGLLGPTRMKYREAMAAAEVVSRQLTERLAHQGEANE